MQLEARHGRDANTNTQPHGTFFVLFYLYFFYVIIESSVSLCLSSSPRKVLILVACGVGVTHTQRSFATQHYVERLRADTNIAKKGFISMPTRRQFFKLIASASLKADTDTETVYLVSAKLKCDSEQAREVVDSLTKLGKKFDILPQFPEDWKVSQKLYGAWRR